MKGIIETWLPTLAGFSTSTVASLTIADEGAECILAFGVFIAIVGLQLTFVDVYGTKM